MDQSVMTKLRSAQDLMFDIKSEMDLKQLTIDGLTKSLKELRGDLQDTQ